MNRCHWALLLVCGFVLVGGCSRRDYKGDQRYPLSGTVTYDGVPIDYGSITFVPAGGGGGEQRGSGGAIRDGKYSVPEGKGANAGEYRVEIRWDKRTGKETVDESSGEISYQSAEGLPDKYHKNSELTVEVPSEDDTYDFDLKSE